MGKENWKLDKYLECLKEEIDARDCCGVKTTNNFKDELKIEAEQPYTIQTLLNSIQRNFNIKGNGNSIGNKMYCVFFNLDHYSDQCSVATDFNKRFEIVRSKRMCFKCLKQVHVRRSKFEVNLNALNVNQTVITQPFAMVNHKTEEIVRHYL